MILRRWWFAFQYHTTAANRSSQLGQSAHCSTCILATIHGAQDRHSSQVTAAKALIAVAVVIRTRRKRDGPTSNSRPSDHSQV
jgi:hypothetical protein